MLRAKGATTANITLSGLQSFDGVTFNRGDIALVKDQSSSDENGVYIVRNGPWERHSDFDGYVNFEGTIVYVASGTVNGDRHFKCTQCVGVGGPPVVFSELQAAADPSVSVEAGLIWSQSTYTALDATQVALGDGAASDAVAGWSNDGVDAASPEYISHSLTGNKITIGRSGGGDYAIEAVVRAKSTTGGTQVKCECRKNGVVQVGESESHGDAATQFSFPFLTVLEGLVEGDEIDLVASTNAGGGDDTEVGGSLIIRRYRSS